MNDLEANLDVSQDSEQIYNDDEHGHRASYLPTPSQIILECAKIRSEWHPETELQRRVGPYNKRIEARTPGADLEPVWDYGEGRRTVSALREVVPVNPNAHFSFGRQLTDAQKLEEWKRKREQEDES